MATTFLFMAVHIWIFDMLFICAPKLRGTQFDSIKTWGSWEHEGSVSDIFGALDLLYDMPPKNFLMPHDQLELLYKLALVSTLIALSIAEKIQVLCQSVSWVTFGRPLLKTKHQAVEPSSNLCLAIKDSVLYLPRRSPHQPSTKSLLGV